MSTQEVIEEQSNIIATFPELFTEISKRYISNDKKEEYNTFIIEQMEKFPIIFDPTFFDKERKRRRKAKRLLVKEKKERERDGKIDDLHHQLSTSLSTRYEFVDSLEDFVEPSGDTDKAIANLNTLYVMEKKNNVINILMKIYLGKHANYLLELCEKDKAYFQHLLQTNNISYSRTEIAFAIKLGKMASIFPKICRLNVPLRFLKSNLSLLEDCLRKYESFWKEA